MKTKILAAIALAVGLCAPAFAQIYIDEQGNFFDCCGLRSLGNQDIVDESYMGRNVYGCDPGGFTNCQYIRGQVTVSVYGQSYGYSRCSPTYCYATIPNPPEFFNATYDSATATFTEGVPVTDNNGNPLQWTCVGRRTVAAPFECTTWQLASTMNFTDPLGYGTLHFHLHSAHSSDIAYVRTYISWIPNPNYVPPPPPPTDD